MTEIVVPVTLFLSGAFMIVGVTKIISDGLTRRRMINAGVTPEMVKAITEAPEELGLYSALKWGLVVGAVGLALVIVQFLPYRMDDPIMLGLGLVFGAAGLLVYYALGRRLVRQGGARHAP